MNMMQPEPTQIATTRAIDDFGQEYVVHIVIREFTSDRKLQRAVDEARPHYVANAVRDGTIIESSLPGEHTFTFMRQGSNEGDTVYYYHRVYKLVGQEYSGEL